MDSYNQECHTLTHRRPLGEVVQVISICCLILIPNAQKKKKQKTKAQELRNWTGFVRTAGCGYWRELNQYDSSGGDGEW
jgi:hypothetical protein